MPDELRLSKSSIDLFEDCDYAWYLGYVLRIKGSPTLQMIRGRAVHAGIEAYWKGEDHVGATVREFTASVDSIPDADVAAAGEALGDAHRLVGTYVTKIAPTFTPNLVEAKFAIRVNGVLVTGAIDAATETEVHDTKTTSTPSKVDPERHRVEMTLYQWGAQSLGLSPERLVLDVVGVNGRSKSVEVQPDEAGAAELVGYVADRIGSGVFEPTGARTGQCGRCSFASTCKFSTV